MGQKALQEMLAEHLQRSIAKLGRTWHIQARGLPQAHPPCLPLHALNAAVMLLHALGISCSSHSHN